MPMTLEKGIDRPIEDLREVEQVSCGVSADHLGGGAWPCHPWHFEHTGTGGIDQQGRALGGSSLELDQAKTADMRLCETECLHKRSRRTISAQIWRWLRKQPISAALSAKA